MRSSKKYVVWVFSELAIIGADIQEVMGAAIAFKCVSVVEQ
jgi:Mn2+/Fe2+ NRAMP family transporter